MMTLGIDFGSKLAGTTVIAYNQGEGVCLTRSEKNQDADQMIRDFVEGNEVNVVGIDAPLSLPGVYTGLFGFEDYHYRVCDRELKAMSPMFLGGLTARAMKLKKDLEEMNVQVFETYPVMTGKNLSLVDFGYRTKNPDYSAIITALEKLDIRLAPETKITSSHDLDSVLALHTTLRIDKPSTNTSGNPSEGLIYY